MSAPDRIPALRAALDFMPSPMQEHPGLLIRDPHRYTDAIVILPPAVASALPLFDGAHDVLDLQAHFARISGELLSADIVRGLIDALSEHGLLDDDAFARRRDACHAAWGAATSREPAHAGQAYAAEPDPLRAELAGYLAGMPGAREDLLGLAAPHVTPSGGAAGYGAAYALLPGDAPGEDVTYAILGTSHYGAPDRFGLTRKPYATPLGPCAVDQAAVDFLAREGGDAVVMEDYCHSFEHSIEFQCVFLKHMLGERARVLPILCGSFGRALLARKRPEEDAGVRRFFQALGQLAETEGTRVRWILGIDLAHIGRRYGDAFTARAGEGFMEDVARRDRERLDRVCAGDAAGLLELAMPGGDELRWCGFSPLYTFLEVMPEARGRLIRYDQWNIDAESVVSFAALAFTRP